MGREIKEVNFIFPQWNWFKGIYNMISKIIYNAIKNNVNEIELESKEGCAICGINNSIGWFIRKNILSKSFTDFTFMKNKNSKWICLYCKELLSGNLMKSKNDKNCGLRNFSFLVEDNNFKIINRNEWEYYLFEYNYKIPFILCLTKTGQKHIFNKAKLSDNNNIFYINTEEISIYFNRNYWNKIYIELKKLYNNGISKKELLSEISIKKINKFKISFDLIIKLKKIRNNIEYQLIIDSLYKIKEEKNND